MAYHVINIRVDPNYREDNKDLIHRRRNLTYRIFLITKRLLDHDIICFMNLEKGDTLIKVSVRQLSEKVMDDLATSLLKEYPFLKLEFVSKETPELAEVEDG